MTESQCSLAQGRAYPFEWVKSAARGCGTTRASVLLSLSRNLACRNIHVLPGQSSDLVASAVDQHKKPDRRRVPRGAAFDRRISDSSARLTIFDKSQGVWWG